MKVLAFIDHDIICRHFVSSGVLAPLARHADTLFVFPDDGGRRVKLDPNCLPLEAPWTRLPIDPRRQQIWRWQLYADQLKLRPGSHEGALRRFRRRALGWKASLLLTIAGLPLAERLFVSWTRSLLASKPNRALEEMLDRECPDVVVHPSVLDGVFINDLIDSCARRGIPTVVMMNSWDNPSTKRAMVGRPDWLLVWGPHTREHAIRFVGTLAERTIEFGAAQFDVFREKPRYDRATLCRDYGLDAALPIVLFAGANTQTDEFAALEELDADIEGGRLPPMSVIYRPHPWGGAGASGERFMSHSFRNIRIDRTMRALLENVARGDRASLTLPEYRDTHDLLANVDIVISPLSTILVEATLHAKPVICLFPEESATSARNINSVPLFHFEEFFALPDVAVARSNSALQKALRELAASGEAARRGERLRIVAKRFVATFDQPWGERFVQFLAANTHTRGSAAQDKRSPHE